VDPDRQPLVVASVHHPLSAVRQGGSGYGLTCVCTLDDVGRVLLVSRVVPYPKVKANHK
jgi:hypothetical protein